MRYATAFIVMTLVATGACNDLRDFQGDWSGRRIGDAPAVRVGITDSANATLSISAIDTHGLHGTLEVDKVIPTAVELVPIEGAESDQLAGMTFTGSPIRVYLAFAATSEGDALVMVALYDDQRIEVRLMRGGLKPLYGIFSLSLVAS